MKRKALVLFGLFVCVLTVFVNAVSADAAAAEESGFDFSKGKVKETVDKIAEKYIGKDIAGASIAIVHKGEVVLQEGYGAADIEKNIGISPTDTLMEAGSVSKVFTWTAVMQLVEQGKIDLDADIQEYLPKNHLDLAFKEPITMAHLLAHTAGYEERMELIYVGSASKILSLEEFSSKKYAPKQVYAPGAVVAYSNYGTDLAGFIIECVSRKPFAEYIKENIFVPLGMNNSYFEINYSSVDGLMGRKAKGYAKAKKGFQLVPDIYVNDGPAGALITTAEDLALFMLAHMNKTGAGNGKLFESTETLSKMHDTLFFQDDALPVNAHGFWESVQGGKKTIGHGGNTVGFTANLIMEADGDTGICILTNAAKDASGISSELTTTFIGSGKIPVTEYSGEKHGKEVEGKYSSSRTVKTRFMKLMYTIMGENFTVKQNDNGGITVAAPMYGVSSEYQEVSPYLFVRTDDEETIMDKAGMNLNRLYFIRDDSGAVTALSFGSVDINLKIPFWKAQIFVLLFMLVSIVAFAAGLIWSLCLRAKKRKLTGAKSKMQLSGMLGLSILGLALLVNIAVQMLIFFGNVTQAYSAYYPNIIISIVILLLQIIVMLFTVKNLKKEENSVFQKSYGILLCVITIANIVFFYSQNFYSFG